MMQTKTAIEREIKKLQKIQKEHKDDVLISRLAYLVSENLRWAIEETSGWSPPSVDVLLNAKCLRDELKKEETK